LTELRDLERRYRRWLRCYPKWFRAEHEEEMLAVLVAGAGENQPRPEPLDCLNLVSSALCVRLRPRVPHSARTVFAALRVLYLGALVELAVLVTVVATMGDVRSNARSRDPHYGAGQWHSEVGKLERLVGAAAIAVLFWLLMAWAVGRGHRWPRIPLAIFFVFNLWGLGNGLENHSATVAPADLIAGVVLCLVELAAVALVFRARAPGVRST
jgi:hypothetical protein